MVHIKILILPLEFVKRITEYDITDIISTI